ncbi:MAG TPA: DUF1800 domain-containing protein [Tepidisphaeraceae bacterium]|jgi:hypothetical protein|nr:DUF1800 domain-containing protein [Tepidisphaeraceae bacterium]
MNKQSIQRDGRRGAVAAILLAFAIICPITAYATEAQWSRDDAAHLLRRAGFGGTPTQIEAMHALGRDGAVDYLITGTLPSGSEAPFAHVELPPLTFSLEFDSRVQGPAALYSLQQMKVWWLDRMVRTDRPLEEKMTLFWHGLFTSGIREVRSVEWLANQNALFHREAIGNYKRLTHEIIHDPAMLKYLNNDENLKGRPNENLARELLELFTMGEGNGYTEKDIPEVARALTGMTGRRYKGFGRQGKSDASGGHAEFVQRFHDDEPKTIFGKTGDYKPDDVVDLIFDQPQPSGYLAKRLWQFFGNPSPSDDEIAPVAEALRSGNWDLAPALRALFTSPAFYGDRSKWVVIKSPVELEASTLRLLEEPSQPRMLGAGVFAMNQLGQQLFEPPNVKGWPGGEHWMTSSAVFLRYNVAFAMANGMLGQNFGRFGFGGGGKGLKAAKATPKGAAPAEAAKTDTAAVPATQESVKGKNGDTATVDARRERIKAIRQEEAEKVREEITKLPPLPSPGQMVLPSKLFAALGNDPTPGQIVDAAIARFVQQPMPADKKATLAEALGAGPLKLGEPESDGRVRKMIGLLLSTPEYQVE